MKFDNEVVQILTYLALTDQPVTALRGYRLCSTSKPVFYAHSPEETHARNSGLRSVVRSIQSRRNGGKRVKLPILEEDFDISEHVEDDPASKYTAKPLIPFEYHHHQSQFTTMAKQSARRAKKVQHRPRPPQLSDDSSVESEGTPVAAPILPRALSGPGTVEGHNYDIYVETELDEGLTGSTGSPYHVSTTYAARGVTKSNGETLDAMVVTVGDHCEGLEAPLVEPNFISKSGRHLFVKVSTGKLADQTLLQQAMVQLNKCKKRLGVNSESRDLAIKSAIQKLSKTKETLVLCILLPTGIRVHADELQDPELALVGRDSNPPKHFVTTEIIYKSRNIIFSLLGKKTLVAVGHAFVLPIRGRKDRTEDHVESNPMESVAAGILRRMAAAGGDDDDDDDVDSDDSSGVDDDDSVPELVGAMGNIKLNEGKSEQARRIVFSPRFLSLAEL